MQVVERQNVTRLVINGVYHRPGHGDEFAHTEKRRKNKIKSYSEDVSVGAGRDVNVTGKFKSRHVFSLVSFFFTIIKQSNTNMSAVSRQKTWLFD